MPVTCDDTSAVLLELGLVSADELGELRRKLALTESEHDARRLCVALELEGRLTHYQSNAVQRDDAHSLLIGNYLLLEPIGSGGMGEVFKARHRLMNRIVAVKMLHPETLRSPDLVERFYREVRVAARLSHPNIVTAFDAGEHGGRCYLVSEYVDGKTLAEVVRERGRLPLEPAINCIIQAARGLDCAHSNGIVHRDVKPGNLIVSRDGVVKVLDMGLARVRDVDAAGEPTLTPAGQIFGTPEYVAPEQAINAATADHRADIYSLGCTMYRLLTGQVPYPGTSVLEVVKAQREQPVPDLLGSVAGAPAELQRIFERMVAKTPDQRFPAAKLLLDKLEGCFPGCVDRPVSLLEAVPDDETTRVVAEVGSQKFQSVARALREVGGMNINVWKAAGIVAAALAMALLMVTFVSGRWRTAARPLSGPLMGEKIEEIVPMNPPDYQSLLRGEWTPVFHNRDLLPANVLVDSAKGVRVRSELTDADMKCRDAIICATVTLSDSGWMVGVGFTSASGGPAAILSAQPTGPRDRKCTIVNRTAGRGGSVARSRVVRVPEGSFELAMAVIGAQSTIYIDGRRVAEAKIPEVDSDDPRSPILLSDDEAWFSQVKVMSLNVTDQSSRAEHQP